MTEKQKNSTEAQKTEQELPKTPESVETKQQTEEVKTDFNKSQNEKINQDFDKKLENITDYEEILRTLRPEFESFLEKENKDFFDNLSENEKEMVKIALWNEVMKKNDLKKSFGDISKGIMSLASSFIGKENILNQKGDEKNEKQVDKLLDQIKDQFNSILKDPVEKLKKYKKDNKDKEFKNISEIAKILDNNYTSTNDVDFFNTLEENQQKFLKQFEGQGNLSQTGSEMVDAINKLPKTFKEKVVNMIENLSQVPIINIFISLFLGKGFLEELKKEHKPFENMFENLQKFLAENRDDKLENIKNIFSNNPEKEKNSPAFKNIYEQAKKRKIDASKPDFWQKVFEADENGVNFYAQLKKYLLEKVDHNTEEKDFFGKVLKNFKFEKNKKQENKEEINS